MASLPLQLPPSPPEEYLADLCDHIAVVSMADSFRKQAYPWQKSAMSHMLKMMNPKLSIDPGVILLCQPTGGDKSLHGIFCP